VSAHDTDAEPWHGIVYTPTGGGTPLLTLTHTPNCAPPLGVCVYCSSGVFVHSVGLVSWAIPRYSRYWYVYVYWYVYPKTVFYCS